MKIPRIHCMLDECVSAETAFMQTSYPYGKVARCQRRNWLEFKPGKTGGFRYVTQTEDPNTGRWNKPKPGTYTFLAVLVLTDEHTTDRVPVTPNSVTSFGIGLNDSEDKLDAFVAAFEDEFDENQKKQADLLRRLIPHFGIRRSGKFYHVRDADTGEVLTSNVVTAGDPIFAATVVTAPENLALPPFGGDRDVLSDLKKYNPPLQYLNEHRRFGMLDSHQLGKRLLVEFVLDETRPSVSTPSVNAHVTPDSASEFCPEVDPDQAASPFTDGD